MDIGKARMEIADHYSKLEELQKLLEEMADVINCILHVGLQWGELNRIEREAERKVERQIGRIK